MCVRGKGEQHEAKKVLFSCGSKFRYKENIKRLKYRKVQEA